ncbi:MAG TPA: amidohydrolase family protein [Candidatus Limnocylindria bacterium]|nr:amidohydrolase family protein [Candidatus Limnocylindria bacterium]
MGALGGAARTTFDASGLVVAPGFVDLHTHYDAQILWDPLLSISPWHGVTTVVMGNCGFGVAPTRPAHRELVLRTLEKVEGMSLACLMAGCGDEWPFETFPQYLDAVERRGSAINVAALLGHTPLRFYVMGEDAIERPATEDEVAAMRRLVREAIDAGALGFATSKSPTHVGFRGRPVPSRAAELSEIRALAGALGEAGRGVVQATVGSGFFIDELAALSRETGRPITWTALLAGLLGPGSHRSFLDWSARVLATGARVVPQVSCRPLNFEFDLAEPFPFESVPAFGPISAADHAGKLRLYADPEFRAALRAGLEPGRSGPFSMPWERVVVTHVPGDPALAERSLVEVARARGTTPLDCMIDLSLESDLGARFRMAILNVDEDEVAELLTHPDTVLGLSDAGAHASQLCDACFSTHLLGHWVRERGTLTLEQAVHMLTGRPADVMGIGDRGRLVPGLAADVVVFDPARVAPGPLRRVRDLPAGAARLVADAHGLEAVIVNGTPVRERNVDRVTSDGPLPGRLLRGGRAPA